MNVTTRIQSLQLKMQAARNQYGHFTALAEANAHAPHFYTLARRYADAQQRIAGDLRAAQLERFTQHVNPFVVLIGATARSGHSMLARDLSELVADELDHLLPGHGLTPVSAACVASQHVERMLSVV